jgi:coatomer protein complex subunit gamma
VLENVTMLSLAEDEECGLVEEFIIPAAAITQSAPATIYVSFARSSSDSFDVATFNNVLKFTSKEIDLDTGEPEEQGYDDEYEVDTLAITPGDYFLPTYIGNFQGTWDSYGAHNEVSSTFTLSSMKSIQGHPPTPFARTPSANLDTDL